MNAIETSKRELERDIESLYNRALLAKDDIVYFAQRQNNEAVQAARDSYVRLCEMLARKRAVREAVFVPAEVACVQMMISAGLMSD